MMMFTAFLDASGKAEANFRMLTVGGAVAAISKWKRFEKQWQPVLDNERIKVFHMTDFAASKGEFKSWKGDGDRRVNFTQRSTRIIRENTDKLVAVSVDLEGWELLNHRYLLEEVYGSPYAFCGLTAIGIVNKWAKRRGTNNSIEFVFEDGDEGKGLLYDRCKREGIEPIFRSKEKAIPCQAADLIAWKNRICATEGAKLTEGDVARMEAILLSLDNIRVRPSSYVIMSRKSLLAMCRENIPIRKPATVVH